MRIERNRDETSETATLPWVKGVGRCGDGIDRTQRVHRPTKLLGEAKRLLCLSWVTYDARVKPFLPSAASKNVQVARRRRLGFAIVAVHPVESPEAAVNRKWETPVAALVGLPPERAMLINSVPS